MAGQHYYFKSYAAHWNQTRCTADTLNSPDIKECWCIDGNKDRALLCLFSDTQADQQRIPPYHTKNCSNKAAAPYARVDLLQILQGQV